jgi:hypothetical protein
MTAKRAIKLFAAIGFVLVALAAVSAWNSPATGYESSIYWSTPILVWACLIYCIVCGIAIIVHQAYRRDEHSNLWIIGLILLLVSNTLILSLYIIRGYAMWNASGDTGTHLGIIQNIINTGSFALNTVWHPITHIHTAQISQIFNTSPESIVQWMPIVIAPLYVVFIYYLARSILRKKREAMVATIAASALTYGAFLAFIPNLIANMVFPMILFLFIMSLTTANWQWRAMLILTLLILPLFHEIPTTALAIMLLIVPLTRILYGKISGNGRIFIDRGFRFSMIALLILAVWSAIWLSPRIFDVSQTIVPDGDQPPVYVIDDIIVPSQLPEGSSHATTLSTTIKYAQHYGYGISQHFFKLYGGLTALILLALIAVPILWRRLHKHDDSILASLYGPAIAFTMLIAALFFTAVFFSPTRFLAYIAIICIIFAGFTLFRYIERTKSSGISWVSMISAATVCILLIAVSVNSMYKAYPSPYILSISNHNTQTELDGMEWFLLNKDTSIYSAGWYYAPYRYADFLLTTEEKAGRIDFVAEVTSSLPFRLGYDEYSMMGEVYEEDTYVVFRDLNRKTYVDVYPGMADLRLQPGDLDRMENDISVSKLYDNSGLDVWYVYGLAPETSSSS